MRIVFLTPSHRSEARGNKVTVDRWARGLRGRGHAVTVLKPHESHRIAAISPDVLHAHHAVHCGPAGIRSARALGTRVPVVVSLGGTDLHADALGDHAGLAPEARSSLVGADAVVGPFAEDGEKLRSLLPDAAPFHVVPRGVHLAEGASAPCLTAPLHGVCLGGIRPVKGQLDALRWQHRLEQLGTPLRLTFAGPVIDEAYARQLDVACRQTERARRLGTLSRDEVDSLLDEADFLLNPSLSEGASNAILEALAAGRPVCARRAPGNTEMLQDGPALCSHLVRDDEAGMDALKSWLDGLTTADAGSVFSSAREFVTGHHSVVAELDALIGVYRHLIG